MWQSAAGVVGMALAVTGLGMGPAAAADQDNARRVVFVGNNWEGTADVLTPARFSRSAPSTWCPTTRSA